MQLVPGLRALANPIRLRILELLKNPAAFAGPRDAEWTVRGLRAR